MVISLMGERGHWYCGFKQKDGQFGIQTRLSVEAADTLAREGIDLRVINMSTLKPIDEKAIVNAAEETGAILTAEEHLQHGGLGSRVAQVVAKHHPVPMSFLTVNDIYSSSGKPEKLLEKHGLTAEGIVEEVRTLVRRKA